MRKKLTEVALAAGFMLALAFTFLSCSSDPDGGSSSNSCPDAVTGSGTVSCGGQTYRTVVIDSKTWMAENLNYKVNGSKCYDDIESNCTTYGRLYDWATATAVCPDGWHLSSNIEWRELENFVHNYSGNQYSINELKADSGWNNDGNGTDDFGFAALPGGSSGWTSGFKDIGEQGYWWTDSESDSYNAYAWVLGNGIYCGDCLSSKRNLSSVRCVQD